MKKRAFLVFLAMVVFLFSVPVMADEAPVMYTETITVTQDGGRYEIGFVNVEFKKEFIDQSMLPATFQVKVYVLNGEGCIEFEPDIPDFFKKVHIRVDKYKGQLYDVSTGQNILVNFKHQQILADHFSRYCW